MLLNSSSSPVLCTGASCIGIYHRKNGNVQLEEKIMTQTHSKYASALILDERANVFSTEAFQRGLFEVQDASSQCVAPFAEVAPGMRVIDACAGAGGKSLHLAAIMENKGQLIALDIHQYKLKELKRRAKRAGAHNIETRLIDSTKVIKKLHQSADRVLIDAPCSGLGVLRRNPDAKWKLNLDFIERITKEQPNTHPHSHAIGRNPRASVINSSPILSWKHANYSKRTSKHLLLL